MIGFVYSLSRRSRHGKPTQWSHMLGVATSPYRAPAWAVLEALQRERALAMGLDLIEWTYDPLQAMNAHLNFAKLGVVARIRREHLRRLDQPAAPRQSDRPVRRRVAHRKPHVERRIERLVGLGPRTVEPVLPNAAGRPGLPGLDLALDVRRISVEIPTGFTAMLAQAPELALEWRMATRAAFTTYFGRGYRALDFSLDRANGRGSYLLENDRTAPRDR